MRRTYFCLGILLLLFVNVKSQWIVTATVREEIANGTGGRCVLNGETPVCDREWINLNGQNGKLEELENGCQYFRKTARQLCRRENGDVCEKRSHYYQMKVECYKQWLKWQDCTSEPNTCEARLSWRYQFTSPSSFKFQTRTCYGAPCANWGPWEKTSGGCEPSCTKLWSRDCFNSERMLAPSQCKNPGFVGTYGNSTHILLPCLQGGCNAVNDVKNPVAPPPVYNFTPPPVDLPVTTEPPVIVCPSLPPQTDEQTSSVFSSSGFWVGFSFGAVIIVAIFVSIGLVYCQTPKGKATIAAIKTYRRNEKLYYDRKRRNDVPLHTIDSTPSHSRTPLNRSGNELGRDYDVKTLESSMCSYPSWRRDEGYRSYPNSGSLSGNSKYQESLNPASPAYGPYYTPTGESKLLSPNKRHLPVPIVKADINDPGEMSSSDGMVSDSDSDASYDHPPHPPHWDAKESPTASLNLRNGAFYYEKHFNSQGRQKSSFDEDAYMRSYKAYRSGRRQQRTPEKKVPIQRTPSPEKEIKKESDAENTNEAADVEKEEITVTISEQLNTAPNAEKTDSPSDAETHDWASDAERLRRTPNSEVAGRTSDAETQRWASDTEGQNRPVPERPRIIVDTEKPRWAPDVEVQHRTTGRPRQRVDPERQNRTTGRPRRATEDERPRRSQDEVPRRPTYDDRQRRPTYDERPRWTPDAEGPRRVPDERPRRATNDRPRRTSTERPRRTSTERPRRTSTERPRRTSTERPRRTSTERPRRTSAERPRQAPDAERSRWVPDVERRPRRTSSERPRWTAEAEKSRRPQRNPEGSRNQQEDPRDNRYAQLVKRPGEKPKYGSERARDLGSNPARGITDDRRRNLERLNERRNNPEEPPSLPQRNPRRGDDDFDFPPPPAFLKKN